MVIKRNGLGKWFRKLPNREGKKLVLGRRWILLGEKLGLHRPIQRREIPTTVLHR